MSVHNLPEQYVCNVYHALTLGASDGPQNGCSDGSDEQFIAPELSCMCDTI